MSLVRADAIALPLADESVDLIVTSPPYFALRSYTDGGEHYDGQIGSEATPQAFLDALWAVTAECRRVLKPSGSMFVNLGDKYAAGHGGSSTENGGVTIRKRVAEKAQPKERNDLPNPPASWGKRDATGRNVVPGFRPKTLMGMPWRYAIGCIDQLDLILRAEIVWSKPNGLPESVTDRVRRSHEQWFHMVKSPRYYSGIDEVREPHVGVDNARSRRGPSGTNRGRMTGKVEGVGNFARDPLGKLPGSVWTIPSEPLKVPAHIGVDHFAAFPQEWPRRLILGWSPPGICTACGEGRRPIVEKELARVTPIAATDKAHDKEQGNNFASRGIRATTQASLTGYACACPDTSAPTRPAVVLDPFGGTGTVAMVARALGRYPVHIDLSADYLKLASWRIYESGHARKSEARTARENQGVLL